MSKRSAVKTVKSARMQGASGKKERFDSFDCFGETPSSNPLSAEQDERASIVQLEAGIRQDVGERFAIYEASGASQDDIDWAARSICQFSGTARRNPV